MQRKVGTTQSAMLPNRKAPVKAGDGKCHRKEPPEGKGENVR